jgi:hypothetical protein
MRRAALWYRKEGPKSLKEAIVPFTGWGASTGYMFTLYFAFALIFPKGWQSVSASLKSPGAEKSQPDPVDSLIYEVRHTLHGAACSPQTARLC